MAHSRDTVLHSDSKTVPLKIDSADSGLLVDKSPSDTTNTGSASNLLPSKSNACIGNSFCIDTDSEIVTFTDAADTGKQTFRDNEKVQDRADLDTVFKELEVRGSKNRAMYVGLQNELEQLKQILNIKEQSIDQLKQKNMEQADIIGNLRSERSEVKALIKEAYGYKTEVEELRKEVARLRKENSELKTSKKRWKQEAGERKVKMEELRATVFERDEKVSMLERTISVKNTDVQKLRVETVDRAAEVKRLHAEASQREITMGILNSKILEKEELLEKSKSETEHFKRLANYRDVMLIAQESQLREMKNRLEKTGSEQVIRIQEILSAAMDVYNMPQRVGCWPFRKETVNTKVVARPALAELIDFIDDRTTDVLAVQQHILEKIGKSSDHIAAVPGVVLCDGVYAHAKITENYDDATKGEGSTAPGCDNIEVIEGELEYDFEELSTAL